ncbi:DUF6893 family small protein [Kitasatospora sp. NPDC052896]
MRKFLIGAVLLSAAAVVVAQNLGDIQRYLRIRRM